MRVRVLRQIDYRRMRWKNGGGWTTELAASPESGEGATASFHWRVSIAQIENDSAFSAFPGYDRHIALLDGLGMELRFDGTETLRLDQRLRFVPFAGEVSVFGKLLSGPVRDFNVMTRRELCRAEILHRPLVGPMVFFPDATWFVYLASGTARVKGPGVPADIEAGESIVLFPERAGERVVVDGGGELVIAKFVAAAPAP
ncbi:MAG TPA: HutD family protein [Rudaea sp.]|nr:HutD family protein [Rudaea sp.]